MRKIIIIDGIKYKKIRNNTDDNWVKGQGYVTIVFFWSIIGIIVSAVLFQWLSSIIFLFITVLCGGIGFDGLDYLNNKINKPSSTTGNVKEEK